MPVAVLRALTVLRAAWPAVRRAWPVVRRAWPVVHRYLPVLRRLVPAGDPAHQIPQVTSARVCASVFDVIVGLRLLAPDRILGSNPGYRLMDIHFRGDVPLGLALLLFGAVMVSSLYTDRGRRLLDAAHLLSALTWLVVVVDLTAVNPSQLGSLVYGLVVVLNLWAYAHLLAGRDQERRRAERRAQGLL